MRFRRAVKASAMAVYLYKQAVEQAGTTEPEAVAEAMVGPDVRRPDGRSR